MIDDIAERRITAAMEAGAFRRLHGSGRPLHLDDDTGIPCELRVGYRLLKNAGFLPPELALHAEIRSAEDLLRHAVTPTDNSRANRRLQYLRMELSRTRSGAALMELDARAARLEKHLARGHGEPVPDAR
ncbi:MAG TPA: DnaJ family domain-containing protein [Nevskiaceae bacterium]